MATLTCSRKFHMPECSGPYCRTWCGTLHACALLEVVQRVQRRSTSASFNVCKDVQRLQRRSTSAKTFDATTSAETFDVCKVSALPNNGNLGGCHCLVQQLWSNYTRSGWVIKSDVASVTFLQVKHSLSGWFAGSHRQRFNSPRAVSTACCRTTERSIIKN